MVNTIAHLADIHLRKVPTRNDEYQKVFENLVKSLKEKKPDRIVIVGDLVHDYLDLQSEQLITANNLLHELSKIAPVRITRGNHDFRKKNLKRVDSIKAIVKTLGDADVKYYDETGFFTDENIVWAVWHHGVKNSNPWKTKDGKKISAYKSQSGLTSIDLFHDPVGGCKSTTGFEMKSSSYYKISDFRGDISMFGDIHLMQYLDKNKTKAYCGSLIAQDVSEGDDNFHGYLLWNVSNKCAELIPIHNDYSFKNIKISQYLDFDDLDFEIDNPTTYMKVRFVWCTLPQTRTKENERKIIEYLKSKYNNVIISHKNEFLEIEKIDVNETITLQNIIDVNVQHEIFKEFLNKIGADEQVINDVIALDKEILSEIDIIDSESIEWNIIKFGGKNFMSYGQLDIDWRDMDGLFQINGVNTAGKTTIMKLISYLMFNKTIETESRMKYGDQRFVNNRNGANSCEAYLVVEANGEYFGIKKITEISRNKSGEINGAPTTLNYYLLATPDDEMNDESAIEKFDEDRRNLTQKKIETIIGTYDNFMRIVMTTSDTLNRILSNDMADFIDSLLYDSGLDIFDKKHEGLKVYQKRINEKPRVSCNVELTTAENVKLSQEIAVIEENVNNIETVILPKIQTSIQTGRKYIEDLTKKLYKIDPEIYNLDVDAARKDISANKKNIVEIRARELVLKQSILPLKQTYDAVRLKELEEIKNTHKINEYNLKLDIKNLEQEIQTNSHQIEIINGDIFRLKKDGAKYKAEIIELNESKICPTCGQQLLPEHRHNIDDIINIKKGEMLKIASQIHDKEDIDIKKYQDVISLKNDNINTIKEGIISKSLEMENVLKEIGEITNDKNDVDKRKELQLELDFIPTKIQNETLKINILNQKIGGHESSLLQIEENHRIEKRIAASKIRINELEIEENDVKENLLIHKTSIGEKLQKIKTNEMLIIEFKAQEYRDLVMNLYKKCVHRDGIPRQILSNYIIPKINLTLEKILSVASFKVWLDLDDLRPKLIYNNRPTSVIDCISASGKERTFSSVVLKFALNQINIKAKPTIFLLDEVMGKLDENSVEEFVEILQLIKNNMKKVLIIEHHADINPDYLINVEVDENGMSSLSIE